jgi:hypothetical protein
MSDEIPTPRTDELRSAPLRKHRDGSVDWEAETNIALDHADLLERETIRQKAEIAEIISFMTQLVGYLQIRRDRLCPDLEEIARRVIAKHTKGAA